MVTDSSKEIGITVIIIYFRHVVHIAMNMQLRQCFARAKPFRLKKDRFCLAFFSHNFKIWPQKSQIGNPRQCAKINLLLDQLLATMT